ncbi:hypothetical protein GQ43DRAFT_435174 [Delitschia confertaspora ATCC 74209]|uniref:Uncharacterized protein n=1 Tax=Delitschia confertaspora ATCC 74209 TaxID=1513339 RepID=A0A9P4JHP6_9PLEO|nr:hypothetical protein GQ43DRAFT_435174 [Delitschia confertaspora ATCC 74209]
MHLANEASPFFLSHSIWNPVNTTSSFGHQRNSKSISQPTRMDTIDEKGRDILGGPTASAGSDICDFIREPISNTDHRTTAAGPPTHLQPPHGFPVTPQSHGLPLPLNRQAAPEAHPTGWDQAFTSNPALRGPQSMQQFVQGELIPFLNRRLIVRTPPPEITCAIEFAGRTTHYLRTTEADPNFPENIRRAIYYPATATPFYQTLLREPMSLVIFVMINWQRRNGRLELHDQGLALVGVAAGLEDLMVKHNIVTITIPHVDCPDFSSCCLQYAFIMILKLGWIALIPNMYFNL